MKKTQMTIANIIVLIILILFVGPARVQAWEGDYIITNSADIAALSGHTEVTGNLTIDTDTLSSLGGLESLTSVGGYLSIDNNTLLTSLTGLNNITSVSGNLVIGDNDALTSLSALSNITNVGWGLYIADNDVLTSLTGLENIASVGGLGIGYNDVLTSLSGLEGLTSVGGDLVIGENDALTSLTGLNNITSVGGILSIWDNVALTSLSALSNLNSVGGDWVIGENDALTSLSGLEGITSVGGYLAIVDNDALTRLTGLENLTSVGGGLAIWDNVALTRLTGFENLSNVGGGLGIDNNTALINLCALYNANVAGDELSISDNTLLSMDTANALEAQLRINGFTGTASILNNNGSGLVTCDNDIDTDNDGIPDSTDNCPNDFNSVQLDADSDDIGDVCDDTPGCGGGCGEPACEKSLTAKVEELLTHYYWNILGRTPDSGGLDHWTDVNLDIVSSGGDIKEGFRTFAQAFFNSQEYLDRDRDDVEYVTDLYNTFFDRPPDPGGLAYWLDRIANGATRNEVLDNFIYSPEFNTFMDELFFGTS